MKEQKYIFNSNRSDYLTPPEVIEQILKRTNSDRFLCDTCCSQPNIPALFHAIDGRLNGLDISWNYNTYLFDEDKHSEKWAYCNPPYNECDKWTKKAYNEQQNGASVAMLMPARTETKFWKDYILGEDGFGFKEGVEVQFLRKGVCFLNPDTGEKIQMKVMLKDPKTKEPIIDKETGEQKFKMVDGVYKNPLAIVYFHGKCKEKIINEAREDLGFKPLGAPYIQLAGRSARDI